MEEKNIAKFREANKCILESNNILLIAHLRPDGDALASIGAMIDYLERIGKNFTAYCADEPGTFYSYLPHLDKLTHEKKFHLADFDLVITHDCGSLSRTGLETEIRTILSLRGSDSDRGNLNRASNHKFPISNFQFPNKSQFQNSKPSDLSSPTVIPSEAEGSVTHANISNQNTKIDQTNIANKSYELRVPRSTKFIEFDHHPRIDDFADIEIRLPALSSTAEIIYYFYKLNNIAFNKNVATSILTGIVTDTANFLYPSTSEHTISIASEMMIYGAHFPNIVKNLLRNKSLSSIKLWGLVLNNLTINEKYNIAYSVITQDDIAEFQDEKDIFEDVVNFISNLYGVKMIMFLREEDDGTVKGSLRTADHDIDVSALARQLGGGGHTKASGFTVRGKIEKSESSWKIV